MRKIIPLAAAILLAGCATTPIPASSAKAVTADRLIAYQEPTSATDATLVVTRDVGHIGSYCYSGFTINGKLAARFAVGETARFHVPSGELLLRTGTDPEGRGACNIGKDSHWTQRETFLRPGETKSFRLSLSADGVPDVQRAVD